MAAGPKGITALTIGGTKDGFLEGLECAHSFKPERLSALFRLLDSYFSGRPVAFGVPLNPAGTPFDMAVWKALSAVPWGASISYGQVASSIGKPGAARAVGGACGRNPIPIIIPCHRVLASGSLIGGYSGGAGVKEKLLALEGIPFRTRQYQP